MPAEWMHAKDELYHGQRGPAEHMEILATAYSDKAKGGTGTNEPMIWVIPYGKGRVFTTVMGHAMGDDTTAIRCTRLPHRDAPRHRVGRDREGHHSRPRRLPHRQPGSAGRTKAVRPKVTLRCRRPGRSIRGKMSATAIRPDFRALNDDRHGIAFPEVLAQCVTVRARPV